MAMLSYVNGVTVRIGRILDRVNNFPVFKPQTTKSTILGDLKQKLSSETMESTITGRY